LSSTIEQAKKGDKRSITKRGTCSEGVRGGWKGGRKTRLDKGNEIMRAGRAGRNAPRFNSIQTTAEWPNGIGEKEKETKGKSGKERNKREREAT
jgi:hypothetical protein